ncbi:hypothetical protein D6D54_03905 [Spiroplasma poulsonii]|uniref:Uncharacterized protein n=1 Tax=Spiroplasma poulsonii TaxID=2138 RepID=A0A3S0SEF3_9MOLU|nr:agmatine deiminase family protein [Spiroplasma poulsonii]RUP77113.1 hypothetical protein D6D54_03905 [Spiroplasma poulsonii]
MNKLLKTIPQDDEYYMPGELEPHQGCWMVFPERIDNWRKNAEPAQIVYAKVANTIDFLRYTFLLLKYYYKI